MQTFIFLQAGSGNAGIFNLLFFGLIIVVFWLFIIRPQTKRQKEQNKFADSLEKGMDVVTTSGMLGRINKIEGEIVTLEVGTKNYIRVTKSSISKEMTEGIYKDGKNKGPIEEKS
ncbi:MAG: preprotein translocase subunit YajC [Lewinellaceae bacterium]|nr:preprotein translocase subunit YajC [Saprospiraceae bacterium]MCB9339301.1 preprotein translocase subunit YajC [Lewinellaceae bacterium]